MPEKKKKRILGDQWLEWQEGVDKYEGELDEGVLTFILLSLIIIFIFIGLIFFIWYMISPRLEQFYPTFPNIVLLVFSAITFLVLLWFTLIIISIVLKRKIAPAVFSKKFIFNLYNSLLIAIGKLFRVTRDRIGNSFLKVSNKMSFLEKVDGQVKDRLIVLIPRCLRKDVREDILEKVKERGLKVFTADGGERARKIVAQEKPKYIIAVACERDLVSGIKDVDRRITVFGIPNKRPSGPCKDTYVNLEEFDKALDFLVKS